MKVIAGGQTIEAEEVRIEDEDLAYEIARVKLTPTTLGVIFSQVIISRVGPPELGDRTVWHHSEPLNIADPERERALVAEANDDEGPSSYLPDNIQHFMSIPRIIRTMEEHAEGLEGDGCLSCANTYALFWIKYCLTGDQTDWSHLEPLHAGRKKFHLNKRCSEKRAIKLLKEAGFPTDSPLHMMGARAVELDSLLSFIYYERYPPDEED